MSEQISGSEFRAWRETLDITQAQAGDLLGVSPRYISALESGEKVVREDTSIGKLFRFLQARAAPPRYADAPHLPSKPYPEGGRPKYWDTDHGSSILDDAPATGMPSIKGRDLLKHAREAKGYSVREFAKMAGYSVEVYQNIEEGRSSMSAKQAQKVAALLDVEADDLLAGADEPPSNGGLYGTVGADPGLALPPGVKGRYVPLLSWAQCGRMMAYDDGAYTHDGFLVINPEDRKTFAVQLAGDSMLPYGPGDVAIVYPTKPPHNGDPVIAKLREEEGGDVMFKMYQASGEHVKLTSLNDRVYPPMDFRRAQFAWIYRVASVVKNFR